VSRGTKGGSTQRVAEANVLIHTFMSSHFFSVAVYSKNFRAPGTKPELEAGVKNLRRTLNQAMAGPGNSFQSWILRRSAKDAGSADTALFSGQVGMSMPSASRSGTYCVSLLKGRMDV
jgi:hypothetical protein